MEGTRSLNKHTDSGAVPAPRSPCILLSGNPSLSVFILQNKWLQMRIFFFCHREFSSVLQKLLLHLKKKKKKKRAGRESLSFTRSGRLHKILMRVFQAASVPSAA